MKLQNSLKKHNLYDNFSRCYLWISLDFYWLQLSRFIQNHVSVTAQGASLKASEKGDASFISRSLQVIPFQPFSLLSVEDTSQVCWHTIKVEIKVIRLWIKLRGEVNQEKTETIPNFKYLGKQFLGAQLSLIVGKETKVNNKQCFPETKL